MEIVITAPTEKQVNAIYAEVYKAFVSSHISTFTDTFYAVQYIVSHEVKQLYADAEVRKPFSIAKFVRLIRAHQHTADITIVSDNAKYEPAALKSGANSFTDYERAAALSLLCYLRLEGTPTNMGIAANRLYTRVATIAVTIAALGGELTPKE